MRPIILRFAGAAAVALALTTARNVRTGAPRLSTVTVVSPSETTMCHGVRAGAVERLTIQPVPPFGRPGSSTRSQVLPLPPT